MIYSPALFVALEPKLSNDLLPIDLPSNRYIANAPVGCRHFIFGKASILL